MKYHELNNCYPSSVIVFRDGVGDSQLEMVAMHEIPQLQRVLKETIANEVRRVLQTFWVFFGTLSLFGFQQTQFIVAVVQKKINTRIFARTSSGGGLENPAPGTVVDHHITRRNWFDFFLVSQKVGQGTVSPTHYIIVHEERKAEPAEVQTLAYILTHMYYNWQVRVILAGTQIMVRKFDL